MLSSPDSPSFLHVTRSWAPLLIGLLCGAVSAACQPKPDAMPAPVPPDLAFAATAGSLVPGEPNQTLTISADGAGRFARYAPDEPGPPLEEARFDVTAAQREALWTAVREHDFFSLDSLYTDPDVDDGAFAEVTVTAQGRTHQVVVENVAVARFEAVLDALNRVAPDGAALLRPGPAPDD